MNVRPTRSAGEPSGSWRAIYLRTWWPTILRYCELFLGDRLQAEEAAMKVFTDSLRTCPAANGEGTPAQLLSCAVRVCRGNRIGKTNSSDPLGTAILSLGELERGVFILHSAVSLELPCAAAILGVSHEDARQLWAKALIDVRSFLLPTGYFKERSK